MKPNKRRTGPLFAVLASGLLLLAATAAHAWPSVCDNCYKGVNRFGEMDAQCCLDGNCDLWANLGYHPDKVDMEWCTSWVTETMADCNGEGYTCSASGGGGEPPDCTIQVGDWCPPECSHSILVI